MITLFALLRAGAVPVIWPLAYREPQAAHVVRAEQARGCVGPAVHHGFDHTAMAARIAAQGPFLRPRPGPQPPGVHPVRRGEPGLLPRP
ncbi:2,3-dihydroxybenzoate-AMP ligase, partial [Streptomyces toxytricini]